MSVVALFFYVFAGITIASAIMVVVARNPVHSVLFLILAFFNAAGLFMIAGAEFLALILIVVYVGAVAVLFLFVVMMLDVDFAELREGFMEYLPIGAIIGLILAVELVAVLGATIIAPEAAATAVQPIPDMGQVSNIEAIGNLLYTRYIFFFQLAGLILLVAMIGAIVLTLNHKPNVKRQNVSEQVNRDAKAAVRLEDVKPGQGIR
ncbi:NADH-quinone oxidoreductase subunit J [Pseudahrensia aquimaris]|uniref:NADH-quinone oxidoreductase subunit J n=1 Tax=Pseudahrensia aquimaris TaxID=744461 RepID=A0ABW3FIP3_9HYPH